MNTYDNLVQIKNSKSVCLISHIEPDPDAISSMVVLRDFLMQYFEIKQVDIFTEYSNLSDGLLEILDGLEINPDNKDYDTAIMLDAPNIDRLGSFKNLFESANNKIVIDHHATNNFAGDINIVEICSSTCEIIYSILKEFNFNITKENQGKLYAGIITDTNNFTVGEITSKTFSIASEFTQTINRDEIYKAFLASNTLKNMQLLSLAIENISSYDHNQIIITYISNEHAKKYNTSHDDFCGLVNKIATINSSKLVCLIEPQEDCFYVSMRAKNGYNVSNIAKSMGGGGHVGAAAFTSTLTLNEIQDLILIKFREELRKNTFKKSKIF